MNLSSWLCISALIMQKQKWGDKITQVHELVAMYQVIRKNGRFFDHIQRATQLQSGK